MKYAIISDVHGNYEALKAVITDIGHKKVKNIISLGDVVGYGPQPLEGIKLLRKHNADCILGNHDAGVIEKISWKDWREEALVTWRDAQKILSHDALEWMKGLTQYYVTENFLCAHGSPRSPLYEYLTYTQMMENRKFLKENNYLRHIVFTGHTHVPHLECIPHNSGRITWMKMNGIVKLNKDDMYFINPGSVGQPRNGNANAQYAIYNDKTDTIHFVKVPYNINATFIRILEKNYPRMLANRLYRGR